MRSRQPANTLTFDAHPRSNLIVALDFDSLNSSVKFAKQIADLVGMFKIGSPTIHRSWTYLRKGNRSAGQRRLPRPEISRHSQHCRRRRSILCSMTGVQLVNVHALGGTAMLHAAAQAISAGQPMGADRPRLLAVTILTSMDQKAIREVGIGGPPKTRVLKLAKLAKTAGVDGVVASVQEARAIRKACGRDFLVVTPGVRPK